MTRTATKTAVKRIITKGLTGWEAGKLILQDFIYSYHGRDSVLTEADTAAIRNAPMKGGDIRDYNTFMALCRGFYMGCMMGEWTCTETISDYNKALEIKPRYAEACYYRAIVYNAKSQHDEAI